MGARGRWATREELPDLSQPARNVSQWLGPETREKPKRVRPWWAWWPLDLNEMDDSVNMGLVSPGGSTVSRLTTQVRTSNYGKGLRR